MQLALMNWRDYLRRANPLASALMARMGMALEERPRVKLVCLRLLASSTTIKNHHRLDSRFLLPSLDRCLNRMLPKRGNKWKLSANQHEKK